MIPRVYPVGLVLFMRYLIILNDSITFNDSITKVLVADVGATTARFGVAQIADRVCQQGRVEVFHVKSFKCHDFKDMDELLGAYLCHITFDVPRFGCIAVAGTKNGDLASVDKLGWYFSIKGIMAKYGLDGLEVINDFAALANSIPFLRSCDTANIYPVCHPSEGGSKVVIGAGTGFGVSAIIPDISQFWNVVPTAGGHSRFSPECDLEIAIKQLLLKRDGYVSIESVLSGQGLKNLAFGISVINNVDNCEYTSEHIVSHALSGQNWVCRRAVLTFLNILGGVAGDMALSFGAGGGVFIGGGIVPKLLPLLAESQFFERYRNRGLMIGYIDTIPVSVILKDSAALCGAAMWYKHRVLNFSPSGLNWATG